MAGVTFEEVSKIYPDGTRAVSRVNLGIQDGEFMVLVGPSGCGKTTALRMVAGLEDISEGVLRIGDRVVNHVPPKDRDIAMVFQSYALYPHLSVYENIAFPIRENFDVSEDVVRRMVTIRAERARLLGYEDHAAYVLEDNTAGTKGAVNDMHARLGPPAVANARREAADLQRMIDAEGGGFRLAAWDWSYYAEKVRRERHAFAAA